MIDCVAYGPQPVDRSEGRQPSGGNRFGMFIEPTGGAPNPGLKPTPEILVERTELLPLQARWKYDPSGENRMTQWSAPEYDDSAWPEGDALFGFDNNATYPIPFTTRLTSVNGRFTFYFRTRFQFSGSTEGLQLITTNLLDDGAAYYINGQLAGSRRMTEVFDFRTPSLGGHPGEGTLEVFNLKPDALIQGENVLAAEFHQNAANSGDIAFAMSLSAVRSRTNAAPGALVLSEVLAANRTYTNALGRSPDWVELFNPSLTEVDLSGMSLTDDPQQPRRWVFPAGSRIEASSPLRVLLDPDAPPSTVPSPELNAGFGLDEKGDRILLYASPAKGGALVDGVTFGFQVSDYSIGRIPEDSGSWTLTLPSLAASAPGRPAVLGDPRQLRVNEWMANPRSGDDWFEIYNPSAQPIAMGGLTLTDDLASPAKSIIPPLSFIGSATNGFVEFRADNDSSKGADHVNFRLNNNGESVGIYLPGGVPIDWVAFGPQASGVSQGKFPDGATNIVSFANTSSPGEMNYLLLHNIAINEILAHTDPPLEDAIELQNIGLGPVDISGWFLSDSIGSPKKYRIPDGAPLAPGSFAVLYENQFNELPGSRNSFSFSSANGDQVYLSAADPGGNLTGYRAVAKFGPSKNGVPFGKLETSMGLDYPSLLFRSLGQDNPISLDVFRLGRGLSNSPPIIGPIVISEIHYHPPDIGTNDNTRDEFIELLNTSGQAVQLFDSRFPTNTWRLRDAVDFEFPQGFRIDPGSFVVIAGFDPATNAAQVATFRNDFGIAVGTQILGPLRGKLDNSRDTVELLAPDEPQAAPSSDAGKVPYVVVERIRYLDTAPWPTQADAGAAGIGASLQRRAVMGYGNEPTNWLAATPTPGRATGPALTTPPSITTHPRNVTAPEGFPVSLSVTAAGPGPLRYQWRFDFEDILDATNSSYSIPLLMTSHLGRYSVRVSNPG
ncbi:MAG: hypothetical protein FJ405_16775, partial [Verrucomicrobia bacterium]|nr:hypothetical protein [Verrucomicrobiota bacterium]